MRVYLCWECVCACRWSTRLDVLFSTSSRERKPAIPMFVYNFQAKLHTSVSECAGRSWRRVCRCGRVCTFFFFLGFGASSPAGASAFFSSAFGASAFFSAAGAGAPSAGGAAWQALCRCECIFACERDTERQRENRVCVCVRVKIACIRVSVCAYLCWECVCVCMHGRAQGWMYWYCMYAFDVLCECVRMCS